MDIQKYSKSLLALFILLIACVSYCQDDHKYSPHLSDQVRYEALLDSELEFEQSKMFLNDEQLYFFHRLLSTYFSDKYDNSRSLHHGYEALNAAYRLKDVEKQGESHLKNANIELSVQNSDEAILSAENAIEIFTILGDSISLIASNNSLGNSYLSKGEFDKSPKYFKESQRIAQLFGDIEMEMYPIGNLGAYYLFQRQPDSALIYIDQVLEFDRHMRNQGKMAMAYGNKAYAYTLKEQFQLAEAYFDSSFTIARAHDYKFVLLNLYKDRSEMYLAKGDYKNSHSDLVQYLSINDSIKKAGSSEKIADWKVTYAIEEKKRILLQEQARFIKQKHDEEIQTYFKWLIAFVVMFSLVSATLLYWRYKTKSLKNEN